MHYKIKTKLGIPKKEVRALTASKEDYLKIIYQEGGEHRLVSNKTIAMKLSVSPASVTEMIGKLKQEALIEYVPYKGSMLTDKGKEWCMKIIRAHRIWEVFLTEYLGYTLKEAHEDANLLEHIASDRIIERLNEFLRRPSHSPNGKSIPS